MGWRRGEEEYPPEYPPRRPPRIPGKFAAAATLFIILLVASIGVISASVGTVSVGYVAVVVDPIQGKLWTVGDGSTAQIFFKPPWATVSKVYIATDSVHMWTENGQTGEFPAVSCLTKDGLAVEVDITVRWRLAPSAVLELYKSYPAKDWKMRTIIPIIREDLRNIVSQYTAIETITMRETIAASLKQRLINDLENEKTLHGAVILEDVDLREIALPSRFTQAIEEKLAAEQEMIAAQYQSSRVIILAEAEANATMIRASATAESIARIAQEAGLDSSEIAQLYLLIEGLKKIAEEQGKVIVVVVQGQGGQWIIPLGQTT
ncbi:MAG TPA: prohibitin family protein [Candidatus Bathyarchaeota archaeon]|nr:prohibitin family protein [Candidatus Bathyarchaeota archaeon]